VYGLILAAKSATSAIPIIFVKGGDPVEPLASIVKMLGMDYLATQT
jgi:hypothetical protein